MKTSLAHALLLVGVLTVGATAGEVTFSPSYVAATPYVPVMFDVTVSASDMAAFDALTFVLEPDDGLTLDDLELDENYVAACAFPPFTQPIADGLSTGGFLLAPTTSVMIGTLTVDVEPNLLPGHYHISVLDTNPLNEITRGTESESLFGQATIYVPEPATFALMATGALALLRRRG